MEVDVVQVFEQDIKQGLDYCRICLRSERETRLVVPKYLEEFTQSVNLHRSFSHMGMDRACFMCEAQAETALRMYKACVNAIAASTIVSELRVCDSKMMPIRTKQAIRVCNTRLAKIRERTHLKTTEVLLIDSTGVRVPVPDTVGQKFVPIAPKPMSFCADFETVVLDDDDDDDPLSIVTKKKTQTNVVNKNLKANVVSNANIPQNKQPVNLNGKNVNNQFSNQVFFVKADNQNIPVIILDGSQNIIGQHINGQNIGVQNVSGPYSQNQIPVVQNLQLINGNVSQSVTSTAFPILSDVLSLPKDSAKNLAEPTHMATLQKNYKTNTAVQTKDFGTVYIDNKDSNQFTDMIENILIDKLHTLQSDNAKAKKAKSSYVVDEETLNNMFSSGDYLQAPSSNKEETPLAVISNVTSEAKSAIPNEGVMVDFEDKIPMDVISFVDATDPNAGENIIVPDRIFLRSGKRKLDTINLE